ncbi:unnamed protein product [Symbiodinium microadriaticum]|nr:unnamed protein product [Symbiodinium microadriaticum]
MALRDLQAKCEEKRRQETQALQAAYRRQVEEMQEVEASLWAVRSRLDAASLELEEEQGHNLRLGEVIASEAATCGYEGPSHARKATTIATARDRSPRASKPGIPGPSNDAWAEAMERWEQELGGLRRWKDEAAGAVQRMADGLRALRQRPGFVVPKAVMTGQGLETHPFSLGVFNIDINAALPPSEPLATSWWESKEGNLVSDDWLELLAKDAEDFEGDFAARVGFDSGRTLMTMTADADAAENANVAIINNGSWLVTIVVRVRFHPPLHHCCGHDTTIFEFTCIHITISINTIIIPIAALFKLIVVSVNASRKSAVAAPKTLHTCILVRGSEKVIATPQQTQTVKLWQLAAWLRKDSML